MSGEKFASLTANLLVRKGDATPPAIMPSGLFAFPHTPERAEATAPVRALELANSPPSLVLQKPVSATERVRAQDCTRASGRVASQRAREVSHCSDYTQKARGITVTLPPTEPETIGFIAVKKGVTRSQLLRLTLEGCGDVVIVPIEVDPNVDGSVTLALSDSTEKFTHDVSAGGWVGNGGSFLTGDPDLFSEATGWYITINLHENRRPSVEICHNNQREAVKLDGFPAAMFS